MIGQLNNGVLERFAGAGTTGPFAITKYHVNNQVQFPAGNVYKRNNSTGVLTTLILDDPGANGYSVAIANNFATLTTISNVAAGETLHAVRETDVTQLQELVSQGRFEPHDVEDMLDLATMAVDEVRAYREGLVELDSFIIPTTGFQDFSLGWENSNYLWDEVELTMDIIAADSVGFMPFHLSIDNGATKYEATSNYAWSTMSSFNNVLAGRAERNKLLWGPLVGPPPDTISADGSMHGVVRLAGLRDNTQPVRITGEMSFEASSPGVKIFGGHLQATIGIVNGFYFFEGSVFSDPSTSIKFGEGTRAVARGIR